MNSRNQQGEVRNTEWNEKQQGQKKESLWKIESQVCHITVRFGAGDGKVAEDRVLWTLLQVWKREIVEDEKKHEQVSCVRQENAEENEEEEEL